jgi:hypothetical protein
MKRYAPLLPAILSTLFLAGCDAREDQIAGGSTSETRTSLVDIQGKVVSNLGAPLPAIIVRARRLGLTATTDGDGKYQLHADYPELDDSLDTLDFFRDGRKIHSLPVPAWVVTMETVVLVQREISGLARGLHPDDRVFAVVNGLATGVVMELENESWNEYQPSGIDYSDTLRRYSGFLWFRYTGALDTFNLAIIVRDSTGRITGASDVMAFTSRRGDVVIPEFDAKNQVPSFYIQQARPNVWAFELTRFGYPPEGYVEMDSLAYSRTDIASKQAFDFKSASSDWKYYEELPLCRDLPPSSDIVPCHPSGFQGYLLGIGPVLAPRGKPLQSKWIFVRARGFTGYTTTRSIEIWGVEQLGWSRTVMDSYSSYPEIGSKDNFKLELQVPNGIDMKRYRFLWDGEPMGSGAYARLPNANSWVVLDSLFKGRCPKKSSRYFTLSLEICDSTLQSCGISDEMQVAGRSDCPYVPPATQ